MGEDIERFRWMLARYKSTINIAIADATLHVFLGPFPLLTPPPPSSIRLTIWLVVADQMLLPPSLLSIKI
ncbi:hypothetical protein ACKS0A_00071 [Histoplasma ohiense]